jgi:hypothetical protein
VVGDGVLLGLMRCHTNIPNEKCLMFCRRKSELLQYEYTYIYICINSYVCSCEFIIICKEDLSFTLFCVSVKLCLTLREGCRLSAIVTKEAAEENIWVWKRMAK